MASVWSILPHMMLAARRMTNRVQTFRGHPTVVLVRASHRMMTAKAMFTSMLVSTVSVTSLQPTGIGEIRLRG